MEGKTLYWTSEITPLPPHLLLRRSQSPSKPFRYAASLVRLQTRETQQLLPIIVCMSTRIALPCGGYGHRGVAAGGFALWFCQPSCSPGLTVIQVSFTTCALFCFWFWLPIIEYTVTGHWAGGLFDAGRLDVLRKLSETQRTEKVLSAAGRPV